MTIEQAMSSEHNPAEEPENVTIGPSTKVPASWLIGAGGFIVSLWLVWVTNELNTIKSYVFSRQANEKNIEVSLRLLESKVSELESRGSKPMQDLQKSVDKIGEELRVHQAQTERYWQRSTPDISHPSEKK